MKKFISKYIDEILILAGCACILIGLSTWSSMITWIVAGWMLIGFAVMIGKARVKP